MNDAGKTYFEWLVAAYIYYIDASGGASGYHDLVWDQMGRSLFAAKESLPPQDFPVVHDPRFSGGSLYWLRASEYPADVVAEAKRRLA